MALLHGAISNLLSLGAKLLPFVSAPAAQAPSSSSSPAAETPQIESNEERVMKLLKATFRDAEGREMEISDESAKLFLKELKLPDRSSAQAPSSSLSPPAENHQIGAELESLMRMLERIKATLYDAEAREVSDKSVKLWLRELRGVAYNAEDVLGEYHYEVSKAQVEARDASLPNPRKRKQVQMPDGMFDQIKHIKGRFEEISKDRMALRLTEEDGPRRCNSELQIAPTSPFIIESNIFGRETEKERLIDLLSSECHDGNVVSVVTIVGTGGLGKTTLAQLCYNDQRIRQRFGKRGWLCVSEDFNVERLTRESIESVTGNTCGLRNLGALQNKISEVIRGHRVLLVLDDVWNENRTMWELFQIPFRSAELVKILVTTRNESVAQIMRTVPTFKLGYLSEKQCWKLFQRYAFGEVDQNVSSKFVEIGKQIMKKCGMLPLAVKSIASLLRHETEEEGWRDILENELWESDARNAIFVPLHISYARLPTYLKPCFLYCSMFPKDYICEVGELVQLWIYQGFIESDGKKNMKKIGWEYAKQLFQRSFFEGVYAEMKFHKTKFKLHDMVHDLARFHSKNGCYSIEVNKVLDFPNELYHLYVGEHVKLVEPLPSNKFIALRTLIVTFGAKNFLSTFHFSMGKDNFFSTFDFSMAQKLRALVFKFTVCEKVLSSVNNLKHLRFLSLHKLDLERLPECICSLYSLQNLTLHGCASLRELPKNIENLVNLEELVFHFCPNLRVLPASLCQLQALTKLVLHKPFKLEELPNDIGSLTNLQTLKIFHSNLRVLPESFCQLKALTKLKLIWCSKLEKLPIDIGSLTNLQTLVISNSNIRVLPESFCQLKALTKLNLEFCHGLKDLPINIGSLTNLQTLEIAGTIMSALPVSFCQLKVLTILIVRMCSKFEELPNDIGTLTNLQTLKITDSNLRVLPVSLCQLKALTEIILIDSKLEELPIDIGSITNLETLHIFGSDLRVLPVSLCQLKALTRLVLARCSKLEEIPIDISSLTNLQTLVITGNSHSVSCRPLNLSKLKRIRTLKVTLKCETIGWLRDCIDLQGTLCLWGLNHITSLTDVQCGNLVSMHNLECLKLIWGLSTSFTEHDENEVDCYELDKNEVSLEVESCPNMFPDGRNDFSLMDGLQPHPNLRELHILFYGGVAFPNWIANPISCASLERIAIKGCKNLTFLPFGSLCKLKYLGISQCSSLRFLPAESLPLELQKLEIDECGELISVPGIQKLKSLVKLYIRDCEKLYFLVMHAEPSVEVMMRTDESSYHNSLLGLRNLTSLGSLEIKRCPRLQLLEDELLRVESCKVAVWGCPGLKEWCLQHNISYFEDPSEDAVVTMCGHVFCYQCVHERLSSDETTCPANGCRDSLSTDSIFSRSTLQACVSDNAGPSGSSSTTPNPFSDEQQASLINSGYISSKIKAAVDILIEVCGDSDNVGPFKAIVFSQWTSMLNLVELSLNQYMIQYRRLDGTMTLVARDRATQILR